MSRHEATSYAEVVALDYLERFPEIAAGCKSLVKAKTHEWVALSRRERYDTIVLRGPRGDRLTLHLVDGRVTSHD